MCRKPEYHVNPASESILELGTRTNPYKSINLPLIELFNFMSDLEIEFKVKLSKSSDHTLRHNFVSLNNITQVSFEPYNSNQKIASDNEYGMRLPLILRNSD